VFDLRETPAAQEVMRIDEAAPGTWLGLGDVAVSAILLESGVQAFNGVQGAPPRAMWQAIDPTGQYKPIWNRLAGVGWIPGVGMPEATNPAPDQILLTFDACASFAQDNVDYVLSDNKDLRSSCLTPRNHFPLPEGKQLTIYRVIAPE
jgi:hypothetical protein